MAAKSQKVLTTNQEIMDYLGISRKLFYKFREAGMPVVQVDGRCYAHVDNLDNFFKVITARQRVFEEKWPD